jgi:hypothetical protein
MPDEPNRDISSDRKAIYYTGMTFTVVGMLSFFSVFVTGCMHFGDFDNFAERSRSDMTRGIGGMALMIFGGVLMNVGRHGTAGSGVVLDPRKARKDLEPWNRAAGGMTDDALDEIDLAKKLEKKLDEPAPPAAAPPPPVVRVRCRACTALNDEHAKFCNQCGAVV